MNMHPPAVLKRVILAGDNPRFLQPRKSANASNARERCCARLYKTLRNKVLGTGKEGNRTSMRFNNTYLPSSAYAALASPPQRW